MQSYTCMYANHIFSHCSDHIITFLTSLIFDSVELVTNAKDLKKIKTEAPEMKASKVNELLELVRMDLIGMHTVQIIILP